MNPTPAADPGMPRAGAETATHGTKPTGRCPHEAQTATAALSGPQPALLRLADEIDAQAAISARHGQMYDLERIATQVRAEHHRTHSWTGLMQLLDDLYPSDVFTAESDDPGPRILTLIREINTIRRTGPIDH